MSVAEELARVQLEPEKELTQEEIDFLSESAPSEEENEPEYEVDAIKYAKYTDKTRIIDGGKKGWYYGIMWKGYLKHTSDTEEPFEMFNEPDQGTSSVLREFWASVNRPLRGHGRDPEPLPKKRYEIVETPDARMRLWLKETKPHRYFDVYKRRRAKEKAGERITRADSDYYVRLKRKAEAKEKKKQISAVAVDTAATAGPSMRSVPHLPTPAPSDDEAPSAPPKDTAQKDQEDDIPSTSMNKGKRKATQILSSPSPGPEASSSKKSKITSPKPAEARKPLSKSKSPARKPKRIESPPPPAFEPAPGIFDEPALSSAAVEEGADEASAPSRRQSEPLFDEVGDDGDEMMAEGDAAGPEKSKSKSPPLPIESPTNEAVSSVPPPRKSTSPAAAEQETAPTPPASAAKSPTTASAKSPPIRAQPLPMLKIGSSSAQKSPPSATTSTPQIPPLPTPPVTALVKSPRQPAKRMSETLIDPEVAARLAKKGIKPSKQVHVAAGLRGAVDPSLLRATPPTAPSARPPPIPEVPIRTGPAVHIGAFTPPPPTPAPAPAAPPPAAPAAERSNFTPRNRITGTNNQPLGSSRWGNKAPPTGPAPPRNAPSGPAALAGLPARPPGTLFPNVGGTSPNTYGGASPNSDPAPAYNASADPRRRQAPPPVSTAVPAGSGAMLTPVSANPPEPPGPRPPRPPAASQARKGSSAKVIEIINAVRLAIPRKADMDVIFYRGASHATADITLGELPPGNNSSMNFEVLDGYCLAGQLKHGARVLEWAKVALPFDANKDAKREWDDIKAQAKAGKIFACYTENPKVPEIESHYAVVLVSADRMDFSGIPLEGWTVDEIEVAAIMVALPLDSDTPPLLANPVQPLSRTTRSTPRKGWTGRMARKMPILDSYGLNVKFMEELRNKVVHYRLPTAKTHLDELFRRVEAAFKQYDVQPVKPDRPTNLLLLPNDRLYSAIQSGTLRENVPRRTTIMSVGPTLSLLPCQWKVKEIWETGGLVTFSPTFILRSPAKFAQIMQVIRSAEHWAAYIVPAVIEWADASWAEPTRCPDAPATYSALTSSLFLDQHSSRFAGKGSTSTGGLAVSTCPPSIHLVNACAEWTEWIHAISTAREYSTLAKLAKGVAPDDWEKGRPAVNGEAWKRPGSPRKGGGLELVDVERAQLDDLIAMRSRPHLLPYRRFLYVGQVSLDRKAKEIIGNSVEFVAADDFEAVFSGAV